MLERLLTQLGYVLGAWAAYFWWTLQNLRNGNRMARPGTVFVCGACGKRSHDRYGTKAIDHGWDTSCMTWAQLVDDDSLIFDENGRVARAVAA
ncbi:MAG TPA: hypothetical protein VMU12_01140 [Candidatus Paceibacterota bacterium]|nr:hypothetical protein [Candidatus Paceibacterota bacterium]